MLKLPKLGHQAIIYEVVQIRQELYFAGVGRNTALPVLPDVDVGAGADGGGDGDDGDGADGGRQLTLIVVAELLLPLPHPHPLARKAILGKDLGYCWQNKCPNRD